MLLIEASLCGKKVISRQPDWAESDIFIGNKLGLAEASYSERDLERLLRSQLVKESELCKNRCNLLMDYMNKRTICKGFPT
jgi:hypothetical protein|tara:strand:- start:770 stop:1012 length:243 start_codon:yes stop_codon:yes gene_type:complete